MTTDQFIEQQRRRMAQIKEGAIFRLAAIETQRIISERIFLDGKAKGGKIGKYNSTTPLYINPADSPKKFAPKGKPGALSTLSSERDRKTRYFQSYRAYRQFIGRETSFVNLDLSGRLRSNFISGLKKVSPFEWISTLTPENMKKAKGSERHFGKLIFVFTKEEREYFVKTLNQATVQLLKTGNAR